MVDNRLPPASIELGAAYVRCCYDERDTPSGSKIDRLRHAAEENICAIRRREGRGGLDRLYPSQFPSKSLLRQHSMNLTEFTHSGTHYAAAWSSKDPARSGVVL